MLCRQGIRDVSATSNALLHADDGLHPMKLCTMLYTFPGALDPKSKPLRP